MSEKYNGYLFNDRKTRGRTRFIVVMKGDLDLNGAYGFKSKKDLLEFLRDDYNKGRVEAVFKVEAVDV